MIDKQSQDLVWSLLPKEFKEEVKDNYQKLMSALGYFESKTSLNSEDCNREDLIRGKLAVYNKLFGKHNLTSDTEGEEMLIVPRKKVQTMYDLNEAILILDPTHKGAKLLKVKLQDLFGSKCLPDDIESLSQNPSENCDNGNHISTDDNKPAEPKFKNGDLALYLKKSIVRIIEYHPEQQKYYVHRSLDNLKFPAEESDLEPYIEPKKREKEGNTGRKLENPQSDQIANCDNLFDNILKDSFRNERRLNIAAMMAQALLTRIDDTPQVIADTAFRHADALITESEKGGSHEKA